MSIAISASLQSSFADAVARTREALAGQGFGVLTEIDMKATLKAKLDQDMENYLILGACNPPVGTPRGGHRPPDRTAASLQRGGAQRSGRRLLSAGGGHGSASAGSGDRRTRVVGRCRRKSGRSFAPPSRR